MSSLGSPSTLFLAKKEAYTVQRSLRFNDDDSANLTKTPSSAGNRKTFTYSCWFKRGNLGTQSGAFLRAGSSSSNYFKINIANDHKLYVLATLSGAYVEYFRSYQLFRDSSAWMHLVVRWDTTDSTAAQRVKVYINGSEIEGTRSSTPSLNLDGLVNNTNQHEIGSDSGNSQYWDGYIAEVNLSDGFSYDPSYFGETDAITGQWNPKKYGGGYGTNGFYLNFLDNSGTSATTMGKDSSGNGNNFTPNNFVTGDAVKDSPTNNFSVLRIYGTPAASGCSLSEGNLKFISGTSGSGRNLNRTGLSTIMPTSGKWYAEVKVINNTSQVMIGVGSYQVGLGVTSNSNRWIGIYGDDGDKYVNTNGSESITSHAASYGQNDIIGVYMNMDASPPEAYFAKNGQWANGSGSWNQANPTSAITLGDSFFTSDTGGFAGISLIISSAGQSFNVTLQANFGQDSTFSGSNTAGGNVDANGIGDFKYTVPANALAMCSANLPDPAINFPKKHFGIITYDGSSSDQTISNTNEVDFTPDFVWVKRRNGSNSHILSTSQIGVEKFFQSASSNAVATNSLFLKSFINGGFTVGVNGDMNESGRTFVAWMWNANGTASKTYTVTVVSDSGNKYRFDGYGTSAVTLDLEEGGTYTFNYPSAHPFRFSTTADGTHGGGSEYTTGVTVVSSTQIKITVAASAPTLYYYCSSHSGMGGAINTNTTTGSSNFDGSTQAIVKANPTAGISLVTYTGSGSDQTVGHGLGVAPNTFWVKNTNNGTHDWRVYIKINDPSNGGTNSDAKTLVLNNVTGVYSGSDKYNGTPTSTTFGVSGDGSTGGSSTTYQAFVFAEVPGFSKFGAYVGNGNSDGRFVHLGFKPQWIMIKRDASENWVVGDNKRNSNPRKTPADSYLLPSNNNSESTGIIYDFLSDGIKFRNTSQNENASYFFWAFAEEPFKYARAS